MRISNGVHSTKILGAGLVTLDIIIRNGSSRLSYRAGGTCGNVLTGLSFLGWQSACISRAGTDLASGLMFQDLLENGVETSGITREANLRTPRIIEKLTSNGRYAKHTFLLRCPSCGSYLPRFQSPRLSDVEGLVGERPAPQIFFFDRATPSTLKLAKELRESGSLICFEPASLRDDEKLMEAIEYSHVVKSSSAARLRHTRGKWSPIKWGPSVGSVLAIQTSGSIGLSFMLPHSAVWHYQAGFRVDPLNDTCGAGDWCTIGFLFHLAELAAKSKIDLREAVQLPDLVRSALEFGQILAALSCMFVGARGLSAAMEKEEILLKAKSCMGREREMNLGLDKRRLQRNTLSAQRIHGKAQGGLCTICLLSK